MSVARERIAGVIDQACAEAEQQVEQINTIMDQGGRLNFTARKAEDKARVSRHVDQIIAILSEPDEAMDEAGEIAMRADSVGRFGDAHIVRAVMLGALKEGGE